MLTAVRRCLTARIWVPFNGGEHYPFEWKWVWRAVAVAIWNCVPRVCGGCGGGCAAGGACARRTVTVHCPHVSRRLSGVNVPCVAAARETLSGGLTRCTVCGCRARDYQARSSLTAGCSRPVVAYNSPLALRLNTGKEKPLGATSRASKLSLHREVTHRLRVASGAVSLHSSNESRGLG